MTCFCAYVIIARRAQRGGALPGRKREGAAGGHSLPARLRAPGERPGVCAWMRPLPQPLQLLKLATTSYIRLRGSRGRGYSWQRVCTFGMHIQACQCRECIRTFCVARRDMPLPQPLQLLKLAAVEVAWLGVKVFWPGDGRWYPATAGPTDDSTGTRLTRIGTRQLRSI
jgi:hypothetical protein